MRSVFEGPENERCRQARGLCSLEVAVVRGRKHDFARVEAEKLCGVQIGPGMRFVNSVDP